VPAAAEAQPDAARPRDAPPTDRSQHAAQEQADELEAGPDGSAGAARFAREQVVVPGSDAEHCEPG